MTQPRRLRHVRVPRDLRTPARVLGMLEYRLRDLLCASGIPDHREIL
jgi:hypothetical protein